MKQTAKQYAEWGLSVIPTHGDSKAPIINSWKQYQKAIASINDIDKWFSNSNSQIAIVCGEVSNNLECLDFDNHYNDIEKIFENWKQMVIDNMPGLFEKLVIETTQNGGYHVFFKSSKCAGNQKLARRRVEDNSIDTFIETRGEGGYVLVAPSTGYTLVQNDFSNIPLVSNEEREILFAISISYNETDTDKVYNIAPPNQEKPGDDYNIRGNHQEVLSNEGWVLNHCAGDKEYWKRPGKDSKGISATFNVIPNKFYVFSTNAFPFEDQKTYSRFALFTILKYGDTSKDSFSKATKDLLEMGYGKKTEYKERKTKNALDRITKTKINDDDFEDTPESPENEWKFELDLPNNIVFWYESTDSKGNLKLTLEKSNIINFLEYHGFHKYWIDKNLSTFVRIINNIVTEETPETLIDFLKATILDFPFWVTPHRTKYDLWETVLQSIRTVSGTTFLTTINAKDIQFLCDTKDESFVPFKNGIAKIGKNITHPVLVPYTQIKEYVWKDTIIQREFKPRPDADDVENSMFGRFLMRVCSPANKEFPNDRNKREVCEDRILSLMTSIGYLCHTYKDPTVTKAIIFCEEQIADYDESNGRTGKGLTFNAISKIRKHHLFNGKQVDFNDKFFFQGIQQDTQVVVFDDVRKRFDFEALFSILTEGISIERKGQKPFKIPFERSPKVLITTNSVISNDSGSHRARKFEIEFSDYYSVDYTPAIDLGGYMFEQGWGDEGEEWDKFYSFMLYCIGTYLREGLVEYETVNLDERKLREEVPEEFIDFAYEEVGKLKTGGTVYKDEVFVTFTNLYPIYGPKGKQEKSQKHTTKWFKRIIKRNNIEVVDVDTRSGSVRKQGWKIAS